MKTFIRFIVTVFLFALTSQATLAQQNVIRIAVIEPLSGPFAERGRQSLAVYERHIREINEGGGLAVGPTRYSVELIVRDSQSKPDVAFAALTEEIVRNGVIAAICDNIACRRVAEEYKTPTILKVPSTQLPQTGRENYGFLINAPSSEDFLIQAELAIVALRRGIATSPQPTSEDITRTLRNLDTEINLGRIKFDASGNNVGLVPYRFRPTSRPDGAGCTNSCGKTCPTNCGQTACETHDSSLCCSVCGRPRTL
jgi:ABC-type branched-subunit amino acid transport system substrate-binding protein